MTDKKPMTLEQRMLWKRHPEYSDGFAAAANAEQLPDGASTPFRAGYEGYQNVRRLFKENGFSEDGGSFVAKV